MKRKLFSLIFMVLAMVHYSNAQQLEFEKVKAFELQLEDVMEVIDTVLLKTKLNKAEQAFLENPNEQNSVRLGIIYHEVALNLGFFSKTNFNGYAQKSYRHLNQLYNSPEISGELLPFIASYRASALSLVGAETGKLKLVGQAFELFDDAVKKYADVSYAPEFLRGSVAENLPWFFFTKRKFAKKDFQSIIKKYNDNAGYANWKIMSFTYWAWANQHRGKKHRKQALDYLDKAISLDPYYNAGRRRSEELKNILLK